MSNGRSHTSTFVLPERSHDYDRVNQISERGEATALDSKTESGMWRAPGLVFGFDTLGNILLKEPNI